MKILSINALPNGSTGKIMLGIKECAEDDGIQYQSYYGMWDSFKPADANTYSFGSKLENIIHALLGKYSGYTGCFSYFGTKHLISSIDKFKPDIIHLHNIHLWVINYHQLLDYIAKSGVKVVWTFHDCWPFTGHCPYFDLVKCVKWKTGCKQCCQLSRYPYSRFDRTQFHWNRKKQLINQIQDLTIVTPSVWLSKLVKESFLYKHKVVVINNGINLDIFRPSDRTLARSKYGIPSNYFVILGVAFEWEERKGLDVFLNLSRKLDSDLYKIILVGTNDKVDKSLPANIMSIHRTNSQHELAELYSMSDVYLNPTREENYPTVNMESIACGTPVITFNTGGSPEIPDDNTGVVLKSNTVEDVVDVIEKLRIDNPFKLEDCLERSKSFDMHSKFKEYVSLYKSLMRE